MSIRESFQHFFFLHFEWLALLSGLIIMASLDPAGDELDLCLFNFMGIDYCPGEGFGRSVALAFRGQFSESFLSHPLGIPGVFILLHRIISILNQHRQNILQ